MSRTITFFHPGRKFPSVSITGGECRLRCDHCRGSYLRGMHHIQTPGGLVEFAELLEDRAGEGLLVSGGCDVRGKVPLQRFLGAISQIKKETNLLVNVHTGLLNEEEARDLVKSDIDCFSLDVLQDDEAIRNVLHLPVSSREYERSIVSLFSEGAKRVVPHICVGLGSEEGDMRSIEMLSKYPISSLVLLVFMPTRGTPLQRRPPPDDARVIKTARKAINDLPCPVIIGCMRPRGRSDLEIGLSEEGIAGMANPSRRTVEWAEGTNCEIVKKEICCALYL